MTLNNLKLFGAAMKCWIDVWVGKGDLNRFGLLVGAMLFRICVYMC